MAVNEDPHLTIPAGVPVDLTAIKEFGGSLLAEAFTKLVSDSDLAEGGVLHLGFRLEFAPADEAHYHSYHLRGIVMPLKFEIVRAPAPNTK